MSQHPSILLIANNFPPTRGGSAVVYANMAQHLKDDVAVLAPRWNYQDGLPLIGWREHDRTVPYRVIRLPLLRTCLRDDGPAPPFGRIRLLSADFVIRVRVALALARQILWGGTRAVCLGELVASSWIIALVRALPFVRSFVYVHGEEITMAMGSARERRRARTALRAADGVVVVSRFTQAAVAGLIGDPQGRSKVHLIENGVDTKRFRPVGRRADLMALYQLQGCKVFVSVCRLLEKKGIDHAIRAFAGIAARHPTCRYLVVGTGPYQDTLQQIARECGVQGQVVFAGDVTDTDLVAHYCLGDVFVMPNRELANGDTEGFGLVFLEANSCGLPVIAGKDGGTQDAVEHNRNGLVVDGRSVEAIQAAMQALLDDEDLYQRLKDGASAVSRAADWKMKAETFRTLCCEAVKQERRGALPPRPPPGPSPGLQSA